MSDSGVDNHALRLSHVTKAYGGSGTGRRGSATIAVDDVSFTVRPGEVFGLVGGTGSGKSTIGKIVARLLAADSGEIEMQGAPLDSYTANSLSRIRQVVFQDPYSSLNPRTTVGVSLTRALRSLNLTSQQRRARVGELLESVGIRSARASDYPRAFSGGERQRIAIARALAREPAILICDEPTSALDVSVQAQVLNLLRELQQERSMTMLLISHDLSVIRYMCDRIGVLHRGRLVEQNTSASIYANPMAEYTKRLLAAVPVADPSVARRSFLPAVT